MGADSRFEKLLGTGKIGSLELKNRIIMSPMGTNFAAAEGFVSQRLKDYYEARAAGGVGLIIAGVASVSAPRGNNMKNQLAISDDKYLEGLTDLADTVHRHGAKMALQLVHAGKLAMIDIVEGVAPVAPSVANVGSRESLRELTRDEFTRMISRFANMPQGMKAKELTVDEIAAIVRQFAEAAGRAKKCGCDGVEIHGAHGTAEALKTGRGFF